MEEPASLSDKDASSEEKTLNSDSKNNQEYLVMTVEIGDGRTDIITIHEYDDPSYLAQEFAAKHNLDLSLQKSLSKLIRQNQELVEKKNTIDGDIENWSDWPGSNHQSQHFVNYDMFTPKINAKSRKLMSKCERRGTVYERLYQKVKKPAETKESTKTLDNSTKNKSTNNINYGEWLYVRGMKMKEAAKKTSEEKKKEILEKDQKELTFSPTINKISSMMSPRYYEKPEEILYKKAETTKKKLELLKLKADEEALKECKFTPTINPRPRVRSQKNIHEELYLQAEKQKEKMLMIRENEIKQYSFAPNVELTKKREDFGKEPVHERLLNSRKKFEEGLEEIRKAQVTDFDLLTGQKFFTPVIESKTDRRDKPIWEHLYMIKDETTKERKEVQDEEKRFWDANASAQKTTENTQKIFQDFRNKQYEKIFHFLDSDNDGKISAALICINDLDSRTIEILAPIFEDLEENQHEIDLRGFIERLNILTKALNVDERAYLLKREQKPKEDEQERSPYISPASNKLAEKKRGDLSGNLYDRLVSASQLTEMRLKKHKELQKMFELKDCTFRPNLSKS